MKTAKATLAFALLLLSALFLFACGEREEPTVTVLFRPTKGITLFSDAAVEAKVGEDVSFDVILDNRYCLLACTGGGEYLPNEKAIVVHNVLFPTTVDVRVGLKTQHYHTLLTCQSKAGAVTMTEGAEWTPIGDTAFVTLSAKAKKGYHFYAWTVGGYTEDGGTVVSLAQTARFEVTDNVCYYANFLEDDGRALCYYPNGGEIESGEMIVVKDVYDPVWACRQVFYDDGTFVREGYYPVGYSTSPVAYEDYPSLNDIPGFVNMGGSFIADGTVNLYVVWAKENAARDFTLDQNGYITYYGGVATDVVIPASIGGVAVVGIADGAFEDSDVRRVAIPKTVTTVEDGAFRNCEKLAELVFFDTLANVTDLSFSGCDELRTIVLNAARLPRFANSSEGSFAIKYNLLRAGANGDKPRIIVASGSSSLYGLSAAQMEEELDGKYSVLNFGTNAGHTVLMFLDVISNYVGEGDLVIFAPEYSMGAARGDNGVQVKLFRGFEQSYDFFREVDMRNYYGFFDAWHMFQTDPDYNAAARTGLPYHSDTSYTDHGDFTWNPTGTQAFGGSAALDPTRTLTPDVIANLERVASQISAAGGQLLHSFAPYDVILFGGSHPSYALCDEFTQYYKEKLSFPVISNVGDFIYEHTYFYNSPYHPNADGRALRTEYLAENIKAYLAGQKGRK